MTNLIYPTYFRGQKLRVTTVYVPNIKFEGVMIRGERSKLCPILESCDESTNVCYNGDFRNCGFYILKEATGVYSGG